MKCHYCDNTAIKNLIWLKDKHQKAARISLPWCGCDLQQILNRFWYNPYTVKEGVDYEIMPLQQEEYIITIYNTGHNRTFRTYQGKTGPFMSDPKAVIGWPENEYEDAVKTAEQLQETLPLSALASVDRKPV